MATGVSVAVKCCRDESNENGPVQPPKAAMQPRRVGYDCEFVKPPPVEFPQTDCPVCLLILREPYQVKCCGSSYCKACVNRVQKEGMCCPTCNQTGFTMFPDKRLKRSLYALSVYCCQRKAGCEWTGELGDLDRHLNLEPRPETLLVGCQFSEVNCVYCDQPFQRRIVEAHQLEDCPKRPYTCQYCKKHESTFEDISQNHWPVCPSFTVSCPNKCELVLQRREIKHHVSQDCPLTLVACDFHVTGCQVQLPRRDMPSHYNENFTKHMSQLQLHTMAHEEKNKTTCVLLMMNLIHRVGEHNTNIHNALHETQETIQQSQCELQKVRHQLCESLQTIAHLEETITSQDGMIGRLTKQLEEQSSQLGKHQQSTNMVHRELQEKIQQASSQLQNSLATHTMTTEYQHNLDEHSKECEKELKTFKEEHSLKLTSSEHKVQTELIKHQATLTHNHKEISRKISTLEQKVQATLAAQEERIIKCKEGNRGLQQSFTEQERKRCENEAKLVKLSNMTCRITAIEQQIKAQETTLTKHQKALEEVTYTGSLPFEFTMTNFEQHKQASDTWYSPPFYTHTHGYRMCIRVNANGWGSAKGTHLSVFVYLMQGTFDAGLQWPFQGSITMQLLNTLKDNDHLVCTINFTETAYPNAINRVMSGERAASGHGKVSFISHSRLGLNNERNSQYLKEDKVKFRVTKATNLSPIMRLHKRCLTLESFAEAIEPQVCVVPVEFTLSNFEQQKKENDVWYSPAFYTHPQGYRLCLQVYPNGNDSGLGTHISIYTCIMRGSFDGSLKWPLRGDVSLLVVNQAGEENHHKKVIPYTDKEIDSIAGRVTDRERSLGRGFHQFISHSSLGNNASRKTVYLQRDALQIRVFRIDLKK